MRRRRILEFKHARILHFALFELTSEEWLELPPELRALYQRSWYLLRKIEELKLSEKAEFFRISIFGSIAISALSGAAMIMLMVISNGLSAYNHVITSFEIQMVSMLILHLFLSTWKALWIKKLKWLGLSIPIDSDSE